MQVAQPRIVFNDVSLTIPFGGSNATLLENINLEVNEGDRVGVIGRNGAGKTVLLKVASQIYAPTSGSLYLSGDTLSLFSITSGINKNLTGRQNAELKLLMYGVKPNDIEEYIEEIAEFTQIGDYFDSPVKYYSAGMTARLAFAIVTSIPADVLVLDEWISVGDASFKESASKRFSSRVSSMGALLFCTHSSDILRSWATKVVWMEDAQIKAVGGVQDVLSAFHKSLESS